jgi:hypothetical protein
MITKLRVALKLRSFAAKWREVVRSVKVPTLVKIIDYALGLLLADARKERENGELEHVIDEIIKRVGTEETAVRRALRRDLPAITRHPGRLRKLEERAIRMLRERVRSDA